MNVTLKIAMNLGGLKNCKIITENNKLSKKIKNVTIMEVSDITRWLKGQELLITSLYTKRNPSDQINFIRQLVDKNVTALAIKPYHYIGKIPQILIDEANNLNFPIIEIPEEVSYLDILSPVMEKIFDKTSNFDKNYENANKILREVFISGGGIERFITNLKNILKKEVSIESLLQYHESHEKNHEILPLTNQEKNEIKEIKRPLQIRRKYKNAYANCIVAPILLDNELCGVVTVWDYDSFNIGLVLSILEQSSIFLSLEFLRIKVKNDTVQRYKNEFLESLFFSKEIDVVSMKQRAKQYNFNKNNKYLCLVLSITKQRKSDINNEFENDYKVQFILNEKWDGVIVGNVQGYICVLLPIIENNPDIRKLSLNVWRYLKAFVGNNHFSVMGVGNAYSGIEGVRKSFSQAKKSIRLNMYAPNSDSIFLFKDLGVYKLLNELVAEKEVLDFYKVTIDKLIKYDSVHNTILTKTLEKYFENNENLKKTAENLYIHVNTLKYRLKKINEITSLSTKNTEEKVMLFISLKIKNLILNNNYN